ncbi:MAG TPA: hypothetical protein VFL91_24835 [Thermomicrobiales bacterium]|nr:hypothetical protein [Thermomicrobiales bacterium]
MTVPGDKATFVGGEDRPDVTSAPRVVMGGSGEAETGGDRVTQFLVELRALDLHPSSSESHRRKRRRRHPGGEKEDKDHRDRPVPEKYGPDFRKGVIDTVLFYCMPGEEQLDEAGMTELLEELPRLHRQVEKEIKELWK